MTHTAQPDPNTLATVAMELTKAIAHDPAVKNNTKIINKKIEDLEAFYFDLYKECYNHVKQTAQQSDQ